MKPMELSERQREFLKTVFELEHLPEDEELSEFLKSRGCKLYSCLGCGKFIAGERRALVRGLLFKDCGESQKLDIF